jgi:hypothetical protein
LQRDAGDGGIGVDNRIKIKFLGASFGWILLCGVNVVHAETKAPVRGDAAKIEQLERERQDAFVRGDIATLDRSTASDYTTINGSGKMSTKPEMMQNLRQGKTKVLSVDLQNMKVRIYGNTAVLTGEYRDVNIREGVHRTTHALFTRIFVKSHGQWEAVAYQQTPVIER